MKTNFAVWEKFVKSSGSIVEITENGFKVDGDVILINCGLTHIPEGLIEVTGTLDISLNPIESFECDLTKARSLIFMGSKLICDDLDNTSKDRLAIIYTESEPTGFAIEIGTTKSADVKKILDEHRKFGGLREKLPELEGIF